MNTLIINAERTAYKPSDIQNTMTVRELIEALEYFDENARVILSHDNGYTYGGITILDLNEEETEDEE